MYKNELLQEKYIAQNELSKKARETKANYFDIIEKDVKELYRQKNWNLAFSKRKGSYLDQKNIQLKVTV